MAVSTPKQNPILGVDIKKIDKTTDTYTYNAVPLGTHVRGTNGRAYLRVQASGSIANDTAAVLTEPALTVAAGAGAYTTRSGAVVSGDRFWIESNAI